jgi:hypothetical protein
LLSEPRLRISKEGKKNGEFVTSVILQHCNNKNNIELSQKSDSHLFYLCKASSFGFFSVPLVTLRSAI